MIPRRSPSAPSAHEAKAQTLIAFHERMSRPFPSLREIADEIGARHKTTAARIVQTLKLRGAI